MSAGDPLGSRDSLTTHQRPHTVWAGARPLTSPAPTDAANWRTDENMTNWYKSVQSRKKNAQVKTYKQAMKDAQWIIDRRAKQMKEIRDRQKSEEAEAARNAYNASAAVAALKHSNRNPNAMGIGSTALEDKKEDVGAPKMLKMNDWAPPTGHTQHMLEWQEVPPTASDHNRTKDVTVWIKPGVFVVKKVMVAKGNIFEN